MALTPSTVLELGTPLPPFRLPDIDGHLVSNHDFNGSRALLVAFICPQCAYVQHLRAGLARFAQDYRTCGLAVVGINPNDIAQNPDDGPAGMKAEAAAAGYTFPYLRDINQDLATAFRAACTPDLYLFDGHRRLAYRGRFDSSRPGRNVPVTGEDLRRAADALLDGRPLPPDQKPGFGCSIKWRRSS